MNLFRHVIIKHSTSNFHYYTRTLFKVIERLIATFFIVSIIGISNFRIDGNMT